MWLRLVALAAFAVVPVLHAQERPLSQTLTLDDAVQRVAQTHPDLRLVDGQGSVLQANLAGASLRPAMVLGATIENVGGTGQYRTFNQAEVTVTLSGVLERGGKLDARRTLALARIDSLAPQREIARLDLLAETARRYLAITAAIRQREIAELDIEQRKRTVDAARRRLEAGASPESVVLTAKAALAEAELDRDRAAQAERTARLNLAALWNQREGVAGTVSGDPMVMPALSAFQQLSDYLESNPEVAQVASEARILEAQVRLARTEATPDLQWQVGGRLLRQTNDAGVMGSLSIPLGAQRRAEPGIRAAEAQLALNGVERQALLVRLLSTLSAAHGDYATSRLEVERLSSDVLPRLADAERAADRAWRAGAISYMEWAMLQDQRIQARRRQLQAAIAAQSSLIEIQRLTGQPLVAAAGSTAKDTSQP
ncbi:TolC family protein [Xanthomonas phaseoli]|uniref:Cation transporter n=1 Tax=Xanthomonas phaseoli pv. dieffenbachiae TaxID=92828 RepID=A0A1V9HDF9_9XANT|nr:TolC family protein [Xanthomonas phaseoli]MBO9790317.1 TolC family protein [Xanthomonas phaseoli pv. dieffenbachiae]MBO9834772.1 TolC family protein [Xanthomonas phaseoli pv. dieffenbachiae]MBO9838887.1 TolC family protein [Xanthomonas phaseoli pv. dieffenbachiae]MBO9842908.1 TolC family protein [Xanthomonas phaseoli pv. dieffenbachiae]MBO9854439.1 TolC family protein [Xanthomonas phaseoli pv. dieffenbachiae]